MKTIETLAAELVATLKAIEESKVFGEVWLRVVPRSLYAELEDALNDKTRLATEAEAAAASQRFDETDVTFEDLPRVSRAGGETWVQGWVRIEPESLPVRDGRVRQTDMVWWRHEREPMHVKADSGTHWDNIRDYPHLYQIEKPRMCMTYED